MNKNFIVAMVVFLCLGIAFIGCGVKKQASTQDVIAKSQTMSSLKEKADYMVGQAKAFYNSKQYNDAIAIAQYVVTNVDSSSKAARDLIEKAKAELSAQAKSAADKMKKQFGGFGK